MSRAIALACVASTLVLVPRPAAADDITRRRDQLRHREAQLKVQINLAQASDDAVRREAARLARAVLSEQAVLAGARSALTAAQASVADAQQRLAVIIFGSAVARQALVSRAVSMYEHPFQSQAVALHGVTDITEYSQRQALVDAMQARTSDVLDRYRQERLDEQHASHDLFLAQVAAQRRQGDVQGEENLLSNAKVNADRSHAVLTARISGLKAESTALAAQEAKLEAQLAANSAIFATAIAQVAGGPAVQTGLIWPLVGPVTREFGYQPGGFHPGIDIAAPWGTPLHAAGNGVVVYAGWEGGYGNYTCINHGGGISTCYGHQSSIYVSVGQTVSLGQVIGAEGSTGASTGPHVHFEVRVNNVPNNPRRFVGGSP